MRKIRVAHIGDKLDVKGSSIHGVGRLFSWWFTRFDNEKFDVQLYILRSCGSGADPLVEAGVKFRSLNKGKYDITTLASLVKIIRDEKIDIVHLHGYGATNFGIPAALISRTPIVVHEHFVDPNMPFYQKFIDFVLTRFAAVGVSNCDAVINFMVDQRHFKKQSLTTVYNGVPLDDFKRVDPTVVEKERKRLGINPENSVVATIGRIDEQKGNCYFIEALSEVLPKFPSLLALVVGDGPLLEDLKHQSKELGIDNRVIFTGYHSDVKVIQSLLDLQVIPSVWEGTTLTVFEAMSVGVPLVSTSADGLKEVLEDGHNALLVPPRNAPALAKAMSALLSDKQKAQAMVAAATKDVEKFEIQHTVSRLEEIYTDLLK